MSWFGQNAMMAPAATGAQCHGVAASAVFMTSHTVMVDNTTFNAISAGVGGDGTTAATAAMMTGYPTGKNGVHLPAIRSRA
ncbi:MAG TPA: hypothetical protein VL693_12735 [Vicinamibacterales bacterium]|nr:hypothetical protein [Vicinamibacterales bacterium]